MAGSFEINLFSTVIGTVTHHLAFNGIVEPFQELNAGAFPAAAAPDKRQSLTRFHGHNQVIQHLDVRSRWVSELAIQELYFTPEVFLMMDKIQK